MCGIAGLLARDGDGDVALAEQMSAAIAHRGPDGDGVFADGPCVLAHRRLAIIDLSPAAAQPMLNEDGSVAIAVVGEIYNHRALRADLEARGHRFKSQSDIEVVAHLWEEHGEALVPMLRGMFALAVWDSRRRELLLARDRFGEKSLYWAFGRRGLVFASELAGLLALPDLGRNVDLSALDAYLALQYVPHPQTIYQDIHKLPPGHACVVRPGEVPVPRSYVTVDQTYAGIDEHEAVHEVRRVVEDAVRVRMMADVPLGAFLSGGIDSSIIVACMARAQSAPVKTFSIGVGDDPELPYARLVAERYGTEHHEETVAPRAVELLPAIVRSHGEPFADPSAVPTRVLAEITKQHVTVALSGDGGDEAFGGYRRYVWAKTARIVRHVPFASHALRALPSRWLREYGRHLRSGEAARYLRFVNHFSHDEKQAIYAPALRVWFARDATADRFAALIDASRARDPLGRLIDVDVHTYLPDDILVKVDIASMQHGLEVRAPFVDHHVMALAAALPTRLKVRGLTGKVLLKRAFADLIPEEIIARKKRGFSLPLNKWFSTELYAFARDTLLSQAARERGLFDPHGIEALLARQRRGEDHGDRLWNLVELELWYREVFDRRATTSDASWDAAARTRRTVHARGRARRDRGRVAGRSALRASTGRRASRPRRRA
jgi:asparagine synthase (glutamine-hydrolysing)